MGTLKLQQCEHVQASTRRKPSKEEEKTS